MGDNLKIKIAVTVNPEEEGMSHSPRTPMRSLDKTMAETEEYYRETAKLIDLIVDSLDVNPFSEEEMDLIKRKIFDILKISLQVGGGSPEIYIPKPL
jgi:hypothetical protein